MVQEVEDSISHRSKLLRARGDEWIRCLWREQPIAEAASPTTAASVVAAVHLIPIPTKCTGKNATAPGFFTTTTRRSFLQPAAPQHARIGSGLDLPRREGSRGEAGQRLVRPRRIDRVRSRMREKLSLLWQSHFAERKQASPFRSSY